VKALTILLLSIFLISSSELVVNPVASPAPDFKMTTVDGKQIKLSDYKGQVVYLSFWASWCGVCKRNFKIYKETRETLAEKGVVLLNVSMDKKDADWRKSMASNVIDGDHAIVNDYDTVQQLYELYSLPGYEIIDKSGNLVYLSEGEGRDIFKDFDGWLEE
jgi:peroxiredoxin